MPITFRLEGVCSILARNCFLDFHVAASVPDRSRDEAASPKNSYLGQYVRFADLRVRSLFRGERNHR